MKKKKINMGSKRKMHLLSLVTLTLLFSPAVDDPQCWKKLGKKYEIGHVCVLNKEWLIEVSWVHPIKVSLPNCYHIQIIVNNTSSV